MVIDEKIKTKLHKNRIELMRRTVITQARNKMETEWRLNNMIQKVKAQQKQKAHYELMLRE